MDGAIIKCGIHTNECTRKRSLEGNEMKFFGIEIDNKWSRLVAASTESE